MQNASDSITCGDLSYTTEAPDRHYVGNQYRHLDLNGSNLYIQEDAVNQLVRADMTTMLEGHSYSYPSVVGGSSPTFSFASPYDSGARGRPSLVKPTFYA